MEHIVESIPQDINYIVKLRKVPVELDLYVVVESLKGKLTTILSIYRVFDFVNQRRCEDIIIILRNELEYKTLQEMGVILIRGQEIYLEFPTFCFGAASRPKHVAGHINDQTLPFPSSLKISNLTQVSRVTTFYLEKILLGFESTNAGDVSGMTFIYDNKRDSIRPFGFISFINEKSMLKYDSQKVRVWEEILSCQKSNRVPVLLSEHNKLMLKPNPAQFTEDMCNANLLNEIALIPVASNSSIVEAIASMHIDSAVQNPDEAVEAMDEEHPSDNESILSIECDYDFDENMNLIKK